MGFSLDSSLYYGLTKCVGIHLTVPESEFTEKSSFELLVDIGLVSSLTAVNLHLCLLKSILSSAGQIILLLCFERYFNFG